MTQNWVTTSRLINTDINNLREEMYVYHNTEVHLDLCYGHNLMASTSAIYLLGTDQQTAFCTFLVGIIIKHAHMHAHVHTHTCICLTYRLINRFNNSCKMHYSQFLVPRNTPVITEMMFTYHTGTYKIIQKGINQTPMTSQLKLAGKYNFWGICSVTVHRC